MKTMKTLTEELDLLESEFSRLWNASINTFGHNAHTSETYCDMLQCLQAIRLKETEYDMMRTNDSASAPLAVFSSDTDITVATIKPQ